MGPSTAVDGDLRLGAKVARGIKALQWGRRLLSTETWHVDGNGHGEHVLQWGRRLLSTETLIDTIAAMRLLDASMGPSTAVDGDDARAAAGRRSNTASMGPSTAVDGDNALASCHVLT